jgi:hypothetical protein
MKQRVLSKTMSFHTFQKKKTNKQNNVVWATLFLFLLPLDVQQGKIKIVVFLIYFLLTCFCQNSKPHTRPLMMRNRRSRALQAAPTNQPGAALRPMHSNKEPPLPWPYK